MGAEVADSHSEGVEVAEGLARETAMVLAGETSTATEAQALAAQVDPDTDDLAVLALADHHLVDLEADTVLLVLAEAGQEDSVVLALGDQQVGTGHQADNNKTPLCGVFLVGQCSLWYGVLNL